VLIEIDRPGVFVVNPSALMVKERCVARVHPRGSGVPQQKQYPFTKRTRLHKPHKTL
jgi:hypothetical protein